MKLYKLFNVKKGVTSVIGGGGKTTLIELLAKELKEKYKVIVTTSTHFYPFDDFKTVTDSDKKIIEKELEENNCIVVGKLTKEGKIQPSDISFEELSELADYVLVEADGSKGLPIKAHTENEPVIPSNNRFTILVVGADGFNNPIKKVTHRVEEFCEKANCSPDDLVTPQRVAKVINKEDLADIVFINKASERTRKDAIALSKLIKYDSYYGALWEGKIYACSH